MLHKIMVYKFENTMLMLEQLDHAGLKTFRTLASQHQSLPLQTHCGPLITV